MQPLLEQDYYELLEVPRAGTLQQIERAYRIARITYQPASAATYSIFGTEEAAALLRRIEEAYAVLSDPRMRREYDARLRRETAHRHTQPAATAPSPSPAMPLPLAPTLKPRDPDFSIDEPDEPEDGVYDGPALRRVRIRHGIELAEISARTKINESHLTAIEQNRYEHLPSGVYLRGFLREIAKCLKLDPKKVSDSYMLLSAAYDRRPGQA